MKISWMVAVFAFTGLAYAGDYDAFQESSRTPIFFESLPDGVRAALQAKAGSQKMISKVDQVTFADGHVSYQAELRWPGHDAEEIELTLAGDVIGQWRKPVRQGTGP